MMLSTLTTELEAFGLPAPIGTEDAAPVVLTAQPLLRQRDDVATGLRNARYDVRSAATWDRLPEDVERIAADVVLVDMDAAGESADGLSHLSGHRLIELLAHQMRGHPVALVVMTALDFEEIQDLVRAGIHALVPPKISPKALIREIQAALDRVRSLHVRRSRPATAADADAAGLDISGAGAAPDGAAAEDRPPGDTQWEEIAALLPPGRSDTRRRVSDRQVMEAALFLLRHHLPWSALPPDFGSASTIRRRLRLWRDTGVFERLRAARLHLHGPLAGLPWERLAATTAMTTQKRAAVGVHASRP
jgi:transposase/DNA-binding NarL/FixJ family response regulator